MLNTSLANKAQPRQRSRVRTDGYVPPVRAPCVNGGMARASLRAGLGWRIGASIRPRSMTRRSRRARRVQLQHFGFYNAAGRRSLLLRATRLLGFLTSCTVAAECTCMHVWGTGACKSTGTRSENLCAISEPSDRTGLATIYISIDRGTKIRGLLY